MSKSPNKHNRISAKASGCEEGFAEEVETGKITPKDDVKVRAKYLFDTFGWDKEHGGAKLWNFGPENQGPNVLVDATKGV